MTSEDLAKILEQFAVVVLKTSQTNWSVDEQHAIMTDSINTIVQTVMFCTDKSRAITPSIN